MSELHLNTVIDSRLQLINFMKELSEKDPEGYAALVKHLDADYVRFLEELDLESQNFIREYF